MRRDGAGRRTRASARLVRPTSIITNSCAMRATTATVLVLSVLPDTAGAKGRAHEGCKKCKIGVMRMLANKTKTGPISRICPNITAVPSSTPNERAPAAYCPGLVRGEGKCVVYTFDQGGDFGLDKSLSSRPDEPGEPWRPILATRPGELWSAPAAAVPTQSHIFDCTVMSFDPFCCGSAREIGPKHRLIPLGLATYDGLMVAGEEQKNSSYPVMTLKTIMASNKHSKVDLLRLYLDAALDWKALKNLINSGSLRQVRQLSLSLELRDDDMWDEYRIILTSLRAAGFVPFYIVKQPTARFLALQTGRLSLYSSYEASFGNTKLRSRGGAS